MGAGASWGETAAERAVELPGDALLPAPPLRLHRAVTIDAPRPLVYRWVCQLRAAPYSYDWIDNRGRRSPQQLTPELDQLAVGQRVMTVFRIVAFAPGEHLTVRLRGRVGHVVVTYALSGQRPTRLLMRVLWDPPAARLTGPVCALGDLVMARRQLRNLKALAERDAAAEASAPAAAPSP